MKQFIKPLLWATSLSMLLLAIGIFAPDRPEKKISKANKVVADSTCALLKESPRIEKGSNINSH